MSESSMTQTWYTVFFLMEVLYRSFYPFFTKESLTYLNSFVECKKCLIEHYTIVVCYYKSNSECVFVEAEGYFWG